MLTEPRYRRRAERQQSLRQEYGEFILERIEEFKNQLSREELLNLADEAVRELEVGPEGQLVLTEVLMLEHVDRLIMRRLNLPPFRRWRERHLRLRRAQREPTHWGLDRNTPLAGLAAAAGTDVALVVGAGAAPACFYLAAHDWPVVFIDRQLSSVESTETRAAAEALSRDFQALVVNLGEWFPDVEPSLAVVDPTTITTLTRTARERFIETLQHRTPRSGMHLILLQGRGRADAPLSFDTLRRQYHDWQVEISRGGSSPGWFLAVKP